MKAFLCDLLEHVLGNPIILAIISVATITIVSFFKMEGSIAKEIALISVGGIIGLANQLTKPKNGTSTETTIKP